MILKKLTPSSLLGRSIIIIFVPIIVLVILTSLVFYQTSWNIISKRLTQSVVADINVIIKLIDQDLKSQAIIIAKDDFKMDVSYKPDTNLNPLSFKTAERMEMALGTKVLIFRFGYKNSIFNFLLACLVLFMVKKFIF